MEVLEIPRRCVRNKPTDHSGRPIRVRDIERHDVTVNCMECVAGLRGQRGVRHSNTCRKRLTNAIGQGDGSHRAERARKRELEFYEHASTCFDLDAKGKAGTKDLHDSSKKMDVDEKAETSSTARAEQRQQQQEQRRRWSQEHNCKGRTSWR